MARIYNLIKIILFCFLIGLLVYINIRIYLGPDLDDNKEIISDAVEQLTFLEEEIKNKNLATEMQYLFPEGFVFTNVLYGLSWCEIAQICKEDTSLYTRAINNTRFAYKQIHSDKGREVFSSDLSLKYGVFYRGWSNYLLGKILLSEKKESLKAKAFFISECKAIASAFKNSEYPYLESYPEQSWPADAFLAIASLKLHDKLYKEKYRLLINDWLEKVKSRLDPETGLIPHSVYTGSGETLEGARGSSISLMLRLLTEIDAELAVEQFKKYHELFKHSILGFPSIREYPKGKSGRGDVDSGPVIFGMGFSGTIVAIGTLKSFGEYKTANLLSNTIETFGLARTKKQKKRYIFGKLPIADAFICWSRLAKVNNEVFEYKEKDEFEFGSYFRIHLYSLCILIILLFLFYGKALIVIIKN